MGPTLLALGMVLLVLGGAGLLGTGSAAHSRLRTTDRRVHIGQALGGVFCLFAGLAILTAQ